MTCSQSRSHFLRQAKGWPQVRQILRGSSDFLRIFMDGGGVSGLMGKGASGLVKAQAQLRAGGAVCLAGLSATQRAVALHFA